MSKLTFSRVKVKDLNVSDLPKEWGIPDFARNSIPKGKFSGTAMLEVTMRPGTLTPIVVSSLVGRVGGSSNSGSLLPSVAAVCVFPRSEIQARSKGKGAVTGSDGSSAEFDWKLPFREEAPPPAAPKTSQGPAAMDPPLLAILALLQSPANERDFPEINVMLGHAVGKLLDSVDRLLHGIVDVGGDLIGALPKWIEVAPAKPGAPPSYFDLNLKLKNVELGPFVKGLGIELDYPIEGILSFQVKGSIPRDGVADLKRYKVKGTAQVTQLQFAGVRMETVNAELVYADGVLKLSEFKGRFAAAEKGQDPTAGIFRGSGTLQVVPLGELTANLILDRIPLNAVAGAAGDKVPVEGTFSGQLKAWAPANNLKSPKAIEATGRLTGERLSAFGLTVVKASSSVQLKGGVLRPFKLAVSGAAATAGLKVNGFQVASGMLHWETDGQKLNLSGVDLRLYGGEAAGSAVLPLTAAAAGSVNLKLTRLDAGALLKDLAVPFKVEGKVDGQLKGTLPPAADGKARTANLAIDVTAPKLRLQNILAEQLHGKLDYKDGVVDCKLDGKTLGGAIAQGTIRASLSYNLLEPTRSRFNLALDNVEASQLLRPWLGEHFKGQGTARIRGAPGASWARHCRPGGGARRGLRS